MEPKERIKELIEKATTEERDGFKYFDKEKFAELIVRECAETMKINFITEPQPVPGTMDYIHNHAINLCANTVKKHFRVE